MNKAPAVRLLEVAAVSDDERVPAVVSVDEMFGAPAPEAEGLSEDAVPDSVVDCGAEVVETGVVIRIAQEQLDNHPAIF